MSESDPQVESPLPSWERRDELGAFPAFWKTAREVMGSFQETFKAMPRRGGVGGPLLYAVAGGTLAAAAFALTCLIFLGTIPDAASLFAGNWTRVVGTLFRIAGTVVVAPVYSCVMVLVASILAHILLELLRNAEGGMEATMRVFSYWWGSVAQLVALVSFVIPLGVYLIFLAGLGIAYLLIGLGNAPYQPFQYALMGPVVCAFYEFAMLPLFFFWSLALIVDGLSAVHEGGGWRVLVAVLPSCVLVGFGTLFMFGAFIYSLRL